MPDNTNGKGLKVVFSTDNSLTKESSSRSNFVPDQLSTNDKKVFLSGKTVVEEILSDDDTCPEQYGGNRT